VLGLLRPRVTEAQGPRETLTPERLASAGPRRGVSSGRSRIVNRCAEGGEIQVGRPSRGIPPGHETQPQPLVVAFGLLGAVRELDPERAELEHRAEVGFRASASPTVAVSLGTGVVLPPAKLGVRPTAGFQVSF
jgi:hypothetical protein